SGHPSLNGTSERKSRQDEDDLGFDINLDLRQTFNRKDEELTANLSFGRQTEDGYNLYNQLFSAVTNPEEERLNETGEDGHNFNFQVDYIRPFGEKIKFEAGYRSNVRLRDDRQYSSFAVGGANLLPDYRASNEFEMNNQVHALYLNYQQQLSET